MPKPMPIRGKRIMGKVNYYNLPSLLKKVKFAYYWTRLKINLNTIEKNTVILSENYCRAVEEKKYVER
jgi:phosphatidylserine decarboxylase